MSEAYSLDEEFKKAQKWKLLDEDIDKARKLLGIDLAETRDLYLTDATETNIKNYANGIGDDNPLYTDAEYARRTRWGAQIAPPSMAEVITKAMYGDPLAEELRKISRGIFRGVHVFVSRSEACPASAPMAQI